MGPLGSSARRDEQDPKGLDPGRNPSLLVWGCPFLGETCGNLSLLEGFHPRSDELGFMNPGSTLEDLFEPEARRELQELLLLLVHLDASNMHGKLACSSSFLLEC